MHHVQGLWEVKCQFTTVQQALKRNANPTLSSCCRGTTSSVLAWAPWPALATVFTGARCQSISVCVSPAS